MVIAILIIMFYVLPIVVISVEVRREIKDGFIGKGKLISYGEVLFLALCPLFNLGVAIFILVQLETFEKIGEKLFNNKSEEE